MDNRAIKLLENILESIELINEYLKDTTFDDFKKSIQLQDSVIRRLEIIGEAVKGIPLDIQQKQTNVPWKEMARMRDVLIHKYFGVDLELTWRAIKVENTRIKPLLEQLLTDLKE